MKTTVILITFFIIWISLAAQTPLSFKYQAVARNTSGEVLTNQQVSFRISIIRGTVAGAIVYTETHKKTTNAFGLVDLEIGRGTPVTGVFSTITWGNDAYFMNIEIDPSGGTAYQFLGASQLLSVPYALYAKDVLNKDDADADPTNELQKISISGTVLTLDKNGGSVTLPSSGAGGDNWGTQAAVTDATLAGTGTPSSALKIAQQSAASGQVLKWNGSTWIPGNDDLGAGFTLPYSGSKAVGGAAFEVINTSTESQQNGIAIRGKTQHIWGTGISGVSASTTGTGIGVFGTTANSNGFSGFFSGGKFFVQGRVGIGTENPGASLEVNGQVIITGGTPGAGKVLTSDATGLASWQTPGGGLTLPYSGSISNDYDAFKIYNSATNPDTPCTGIHGISASRLGVWGETTSGAGVYGLANATSGIAYGVFGNVSSSASYSGYFLGGRFHVSGNVGIGKTDPAYKLDVNGDRIRLINGTEWIAMRTDGNPGLLDLSFGGGDLVIQGSITDENIIINPAMNKVGIRTWAPQYELDVNGNIRATGSVYYGGTAGSANGSLYGKPDYVFSENYEKLNTEQVEQFLNRENHLPWVTSAEQEKKENGKVTNMTRMAFETLEAVENLQLQLITQDKLIRKLNIENDLLRERLEQLEKLAGINARK